MSYRVDAILKSGEYALTKFNIMTKPLNVFISYSHKDKNHCLSLLEYLKLFEKEGLINVWWDGEIIPGTEWDIEIKNHVDEADIIILLTSNAFLVSDYIDRVELKEAIERHIANISRVIPIIVKPCAWYKSPLGKLQALPENPEGGIKPVSHWSDEHDAYFAIQEGVGKAINFLNQKMPVAKTNQSKSTPFKTVLNTKPEHELYRLYGLHGLRKSSLIQNFNVSRKGDTHNINAIQFLWADALFGNSISAKHMKDGKTLRIRFDHMGGWGCNITIRCQDGLACLNENKSRYLSFDARIPLEEIQRFAESELLHEVGISIRIVNGLLQHWEYGLGTKEYIVVPVKKSKWGGKPVKVDLSDRLLWHQFTSDGNTKINQEGPDFSIIAAVILKFGKIPLDPIEPQPGKGIVEIRAINLSDE